MQNVQNNALAIRLPERCGNEGLAPLPAFDLTAQDERTQMLRKLLERGHNSVAPLRNPELILHSHLPHLLGAAYALGAGPQLLEKCYEQEVSGLLNVQDGFKRGRAITPDNWEDFLNQKRYTVAYVDFFDKVIESDGDWQKVVKEYLFTNKEPRMINGYVGGLGHPFIHLAYAFEFNCATIASEALSLGCTEMFQLHHLFATPPPDNSTYKTDNLASVIERVRIDNRFDDLLTVPGIANFETIFATRIQVVLEHWNAWEISKPVEQFEQCCDLAVLLALSHRDKELSFDFYHIHLMTVAHALRVLWQHFPLDHQIPIMKQYALFMIAIYIAQLRPNFGLDDILAVDLAGRDWDWVVRTALVHPWVLDSHFFKVVRAPKAFAETFGEKDGFYLKSTLRFLDCFRGWEGFGDGVAGFVPSRDGYMPSSMV